MQERACRSTIIAEYTSYLFRDFIAEKCSDEGTTSFGSGFTVTRSAEVSTLCKLVGVASLSIGVDLYVQHVNTHTLHHINKYLHR